MRFLGVVLASALVAVVFAGCMGPPAAEAKLGQDEPRYRSYENDAVVNVTGVEIREPLCPSPDNCTEYYLLRIVGSENATLVSGPDVLKECTAQPRFLFDVSPAFKEVFYNGSYYPRLKSGLNTLAAQEFRGVVFGERNAVQGCLTSFGLFSYPKTPPPSHVKVLGSYGTINVTTYRGGNLAVRLGNVAENDWAFPLLGQQLVVSYGTFRVIGKSTYFVEGGFEITNLGPWPMDKLRPK